MSASKRRVMNMTKWTETTGERIVGFLATATAAGRGGFLKESGIGRLVKLSRTQSNHFNLI